MGNSLRCCIACVLPCGVLDVIRIVHLNGQVDEFSRPVSAHEVLAANPGHVLSTPCSSKGGVPGRILIVSPDSELKRGAFYFLIPVTSVPDKKKKNKKKNNNHPKNSSKAHKSNNNKPKTAHNTSSNEDKALEQDKYLEDILSEKSAGYRRKKSKRVGVWRPHLESISEDP